MVILRSNFLAVALILLAPDLDINSRYFFYIGMPSTVLSINVIAAEKVFLHFLDAMSLPPRNRINTPTQLTYKIGKHTTESNIKLLSVK